MKKFKIIQIYFWLFVFGQQVKAQTPTITLQSPFLITKSEIGIWTEVNLPVVYYSTYHWGISGQPLSNYLPTYVVGPGTGGTADILEGLSSGTTYCYYQTFQDTAYPYDIYFTDTICATTLSDPLPVEYISILFKNENGVVVGEWETASEINSDYFSVERSTDGINFTTIGNVFASGNSTWPVNYEFIDRSTTPGKLYYRLNQVDYDGTAHLSGSYAVYAGGGDSDASGNWPVIIYNISGTLMPVNKIADLPRGIYIVVAGEKRYKLVKE